MVYQPKEGEPLDLGAPLVDVPRDGTTIGEIVMRGNITMKEVRTDSLSYAHWRELIARVVLP